jgi:hypothetical protein
MKEGKLNVTVECNPLLGSQLFDLIEPNGRAPELCSYIAKWLFRS